MKFGGGHLRGNFLEGVDRDVNPLMPLEAAGEDDDLFAVVARAGAELENIGVHVVDEDGALAGGRGTGRVFFQPQVVGEDHMVGKFGGDSFHGAEGFDGEGIVGDVKLAAVEFRHDVVDVEQHLRALEFGIPRGEHHEVRDVVDVDEVVRFLTVALADPERRDGQEAQQGPEKIQLGALVFSGARLNTMHVDARHDFGFRHGRPAAERHDVHLIAALRQRLGVTGDAVVVLIKRMGDHANPAGFAASEGWSEGGDKAGHLPGQGMPVGSRVVVTEVL